MAHEKAEKAEEAEVVEGAEAPPAKKSKKKLLMIVAVLLFLGAAGGAVMFTGVLKKKPPEGQETAAVVPPPPVAPGVFYDLPDILVNLDNTGKTAHFLKLKVSLELPTKADETAIDKVMPRVNDQFQTYLRELRTDDLKGSAGIYRLRQELLTRVSAASQPVEVRDILFREILIQ